MSKKRLWIAAIVVWWALGTSGSLYADIHMRDVRLSDVVFWIFGGAVLGPIPWMATIAEHIPDPVVIHRRKP